MPAGKPYIVMAKRPGDYMRKVGRYEEAGEGYAAARDVSRSGWCAEVHLFFVPHERVSIGGWELVATFADGRDVDETTRYQMLQGEPFVLQPPSPADALGEEDVP